jgi:hypothetical protein
LALVHLTSVTGRYDDFRGLSTARVWSYLLHKDRSARDTDRAMTHTGGRRRAAAAAVAALAIALTGLTAVARPAAATTTVGSRYLLDHLAVAAEHSGGYTSSRFRYWTDADHDGCNTRREVLLAEATVRPKIGVHCSLSGGQWRSRYDGATLTRPADVTVDWLVPLQEAWQSGAWRWNSSTRTRFANDLAYDPALLAVSDASAQSKDGRGPQGWLPPRASFDCTYLTWWVAVKWRWRLSVNTTEKSFLTDHLSTCGWPTLHRPPRARIVLSSVGFAFVGDTILGNTPELPAQPGDYLDPVRSRLAAAVTFGNYEGTFTTVATGKCGTSSGSTCYQFRNPPSYAKIFHNDGYDVLNLANNHSHDFGSAGLQSTKDAITGAGMRYTGLPGQITYVIRNGIRIAFVGFAPYSSTNNLLDLSTAASLIRTANRHARVVVVYMHAGAEGASADHVTGQEEHFLGEDRGNPKRFAHLAVDNGASVVVASGPHVMRGMQFYKHRLIAYSLGDFANYRNFNTSGVLADSGILRLTLSDTGAFRRAQLVSVQLATDGRASRGGDSVSFVRRLSTDDFGTSAPRLSSTGRISPR